MARLDSFLNFLGHYKYLITLVLGFLFIGVLSESSIMKLIKLDMQKDDLDAEIEAYQKQDKAAKRELEDLNGSPNAVEKVARERYFMKKDDEDIFVFSTDKTPQTEDPLAKDEDEDDEEGDTE